MGNTYIFKKSSNIKDGSIHTYIHFASTIKRTKTNLETENNQNCQKIELYGSPTTKELKTKDSCRLVGGWRWAARAERICGKALAGEPSKVAAGTLGSPTFVYG